MPRTIKPDGSPDFEDDGGTPAYRRRNADYLRSMEDRAGPSKVKRRSIWSKPRNSKEAVTDGLKIVLLIAGCIFMFFFCYLLAGFLIANLTQ